uniref:Uncharacterized protein n=1 Tax=Arundo donax TaxID=35708 RepID=A0A0A9DM47_ARUDO
MLELYEQNRVAPPPLQGNETEGSSASVANQRAPVKAPGTADEPPAHDHHQASRQSGPQNVSGHHGYDHPHPEKQNSNQRIPQNEARGSNEGPNMSSTMMDAMKKIDKDKVKAALEKRRKSKGDVSRKVGVMDDDDLIERELEHGVELAAEDEKTKQERRPHPAHREDQHNASRMTENTEEGELSMDSQEYRSPELDNRKRKDVHEHRNYDRCERDAKRLRS